MAITDIEEYILKLEERIRELEVWKNSLGNALQESLEKLESTP